MPKYTAEYRTQAEYASHDFEADTPEAALEMAKNLYDETPDDLCWDSYSDGQPLETITIGDDDDDNLAKYSDPDFRRNLFSDELLAAAKAVLDRWGKGNLGEAVQALQAAVSQCEGSNDGAAV